MNQSSPRLLVLGAHPDDAEFHAGGLIARYRADRRPVKIVSVTNGGAGHHERSSDEIVGIRRQEAQAVSDLIGVEYEVWEFPDGRLTPDLTVRERIIREIRQFAPDLVLTHRTNDYHPDHRAVGQAVQDASYLVTVPLVASEVPALRRDPVVAFMSDLFTRPAPMRPDIVLDIGPEFSLIVEMLACHRSQVYDWLPFNHRLSDQVPKEESERKRWLADWFAERSRSVADRFRDALIQRFGSDAGGRVEHAEVYEISEYAADLDEADRSRLFP